MMILGRSLQGNTKTIIGMLLPVVTCLALLGLTACPSVLAAQTLDLAKHPLYEKYQLEKNIKVIRFATQPLAVPIGVIGEVMQRDRILKRALQERGWGIRFYPFLKGADSNFFLERGEIDAMLTGDVPAISAAAKVDIMIAALAKQGFTSIVTREQMQIKDLRGKRIGYPIGSTAHFALLSSLVLMGIDEAEVQLMPLEISELSEALAQKRIDAFSAWEPYPTIAINKHPDFTVVHRIVNSSYFSLSNRLAKTDPDVAELITAAFIRSLTWMRKDRKNLLRAAEWLLQEAERFQGKSYGVSVEQIARITESDILHIATSPIVPERDYVEGGHSHEIFELLKKQGQLPGTALWEKVVGSFDQQLLRRVLAQQKKFGLNRFDYEQ